jgi:hypothetical protein
MKHAIDQLREKSISLILFTSVISPLHLLLLSSSPSPRVISMN